MSDPFLFVLVIVGTGLSLAVIGVAVSNAGLRRFMARPRECSAMLIVHDHDPHALYFVASVQGKDIARVKKGLAGSTRRAFVWMSQSGRAGDPGRALLNDALTEVIGEAEVAWAGVLTPEVERAVRTKLGRSGVELGALRLAGSVPFDEHARSRHAWWVCAAAYESVAGRLCCDGLEFWLDAQGPGLWSVKTDDRRLTSVEAAADPELRLSCHPAHDLPPDVLGGPLEDRRSMRLEDMTTPPW